MDYKIGTITEDGWISLETSGWGSEPIRALAQAYQEEIGGELFQPYLGDAQYMVKGDPLRLSFQYDDMFGPVVIMNDIKDKDKVIEILINLFRKLKQ